MLARSDKRHVLFLQGIGSLFFARLARKLRALDVKTSKIHLCFGDMVFWRGGNTSSYRGSLKDWPHHISAFLATEKITDIVLFSDSRPYHVVATRIAKAMGVNVFVFEHGYLRPTWITMEQGGVNGRSGFPSKLPEIYKLADKALQTHTEYAGNSKARSKWLYFGDTVYHMINFVTRFIFPRYKRFRNVKTLSEGRGWILRFFQRPGKKKRSKKAFDQLVASHSPFFFFPLQLEQDYQLTVDSPFETMGQAMEKVFASFAKHAPVDAKLLVKNHPLDNNVINREAQTRQLAEKYNIGNRVVFIETGHNPTILTMTDGMVTINSTMGTSALFHQTPMCVLGDAVYKIDKLVHQHGLDTFWNTPQRPDKEVSEAFQQALKGFCQIQGHFGERNLDAGVFEHCVARMLATDFHMPNTISPETVAKLHPVPEAT